MIIIKGQTPQVKRKDHFFSRLSNEFFSEVRQKGGQKMGNEGNKRLQQVIAKSTMEPGNKNIAALVSNNLCHTTKAVPA